MNQGNEIAFFFPEVLTKCFLLLRNVIKKYLELTKQWPIFCKKFFQKISKKKNGRLSKKNFQKTLDFLIL